MISEKTCRNLTVIFLLILITMILLWELKIAPLRSGGSWLSIKALPLCLFISGSLKGNLRIFQWLSLLIPFYMAEGIMRLTDISTASRICATIEVLLSIAVFISCLCYVRIYRKKHLQNPY